MSWITRLKEWALAPEAVAPKHRQTKSEIDSEATVKAPVLGFVKAVKANPKRFRARKLYLQQYRGQTYHWTQDRNHACYSITDRQEKITFQVLYVSGRIYNVHGIDFTLNGWETDYLHKQLVPVFTRAAERAVSIRALRAERAVLARELANQQRRENWTAIYGE